MSEPKFYVVFFDVEKPQIRRNALVLKVNKEKFANLLDEVIPDKSIELKFTDGEIANYTIKSIQTFWTNEFDMVHGQQSNCFITAVVKKLKK